MYTSRCKDLLLVLWRSLNRILPQLAAIYTDRLRRNFQALIYEEMCPRAIKKLLTQQAGCPKGVRNRRSIAECDTAQHRQPRFEQAPRHAKTDTHLLSKIAASPSHSHRNSTIKLAARLAPRSGQLGHERTIYDLINSACQLHLKPPKHLR